MRNRGLSSSRHGLDNGTELSQEGPKVLSLLVTMFDLFGPATKKCTLDAIVVRLAVPLGVGPAAGNSRSNQRAAAVACSPSFTLCDQRPQGTDDKLSLFLSLSFFSLYQQQHQCIEGRGNGVTVVCVIVGSLHFDQRHRHVEGRGETTIVCGSLVLAWIGRCHAMKGRGYGIQRTVVACVARALFGISIQRSKLRSCMQSHAERAPLERILNAHLKPSRLER